jgi:lipopolysaccharide/colanic/teichoic acid biosynthesis glycosyltransferase
VTPPTSAVALLAPAVPATREPEAARPLTPAPRPEAVLVPPLLLAAVACAGTAVADAVATPGLGAAAHALRGALLTGVLLAPIAVAFTWARAHRSVAGFLAAPVVAALGALLAVPLLPGPVPALGTAIVSWGLAVLAPIGWRPWQDRWMRPRAWRVSVLAPSALGAYEAVRRMELVPGLRVASVLVPECEPHLAARLLQRPVAAAVRGGPRLERRVVVSCPMRDLGVGRTIAELVATGHAITSESAVLRAAEGRVDSTRADPLNLLLGRPRGRLLDATSRAMDVVLSALLLVIAAPLFVGIAMAIVRESGFPVFYRQRRLGRGGRPFDVVKFRSMRQDAEKHSGPVWATEDDPRITRVGRVLRRRRLDELPQLWNVLVGDMALVGPRPERPHFCDALREDVPLFELRTIVRPGITGWAQVRLAYGASSDDARAKLEYDLYYVTRRSPWFDLAILGETARVVLTGQGAR